VYRIRVHRQDFPVCNMLSSIRCPQDAADAFEYLYSKKNIWLGTLYQPDPEFGAI